MGDCYIYLKSFLLKYFCRGLDIRVTEVVTTRFDIIRLHPEADIVAYTIILAKKIKSLEMSTYYGILVMPDMIKFKNSNPLRLVEIKR